MHSFEKLRATAVGLNARGCPLQGGNNLDQIASSLSFFVVSVILSTLKVLMSYVGLPY
jgi:hypothetical protein